MGGGGGGCYLLTYFWGLEYFQGGLSNFRGGWEIFLGGGGGWEISGGGGSKNFQERRVKTFSGGGGGGWQFFLARVGWLRNFRWGVQTSHG